MVTGAPPPDPPPEPPPLHFRSRYLLACRAAGVEPHADILPPQPLLPNAALSAESAVPTPTWALAATAVGELKHGSSSSDSSAAAASPANATRQFYYDCTLTPGIVAVRTPFLPGQWQPFAEALRGAGRALTGLTLQGAALEPEQLRELAELLPMTGITTLHLDWCTRTGTGDDTEAAASPSTVVQSLPRLLLAESSKLRVLSLRGMCLSAADAAAAGEALQGNGELQELSLAHNPSIGDEGAAAFLRGARDNRSLTALSLACCGLTQACAQAFMDSTVGTYTLSGREACERAKKEARLAASRAEAEARRQQQQLLLSEQAPSAATPTSQKTKAAGGGSASASQKGKAAAPPPAPAPAPAFRLPALRVKACGQASQVAASSLRAAATLAAPGKAKTPQGGAAARSATPKGRAAADAQLAAAADVPLEEIPVAATYADPEAVLEGEGARQLRFLDLSGNKVVRAAAAAENETGVTVEPAAAISCQTERIVAV